ncbi:MAG: TonB family protein [Gemmatimonadetes bacterium]|nr:TonB family protein [Gemmatimonadota bacterium]NIT88290.1 TonB family protein [Gemmatimonadota bacterium]NIU78016.1 TonB family protein [Gammaproteobacteria bacterium]NIY11460.1 TonB family protein [Gemmatimonadota bacterium]NIY40312.1 TonB family protein [Gemmatimonadota bacterium]
MGPAAVDAANAEIPEAPPAVEAELPPTRLGQPEAEDPLSGGAGAEEAARRPAGPRPADPEELAAEPTFTPFTKAPVIVNRDEVVAAMSDAYPPLLRDAGIGGTIHVYFFIDAEGRVRDHRINSSSGHPALDQAALAVAEVYRFRPALNREEPVPVWVSFPITFQAGESDLR